MNISKISINNILGIEALEFSPGKFTAITGRNGQGKTSIMEAIKSALKGGHDATLLRNGADSGEVVLVLDDGTAISKKITAESSKQKITGPDGVRVDRPSAAIGALIDALSVNPIEFLTVPRKQQISALLEAMPMKADIDKLAAIIGGKVAPELANAHALDAIDSVYKAVFDNRTGTNRAIKEKEGTITQLQATIPDALVDVDAVDETALEKACEAADVARDAELIRIDAKLQTMEQAWSNKLNDLQALIDGVKSDRADVRAKADKQRQLTRDKCTDEKRPAQDSLALIRSNRDAAAKARVTRTTIDSMHEQMADLEGEAERATASLAALDSYKAELLDGLPIPGLAVRAGEIFYNDVPFERVNTATQVRVAVEIAKLRAGTLGLICVDGIERLDGEAFEAFREQAIESGVQLVVTRVGDGDLAVESSE